MPPKWKKRRNPIWGRLLILAILGGGGFAFYKFGLPKIYEFTDKSDAVSYGEEQLRMLSAFQKWFGRQCRFETTSAELSGTREARQVHVVYSIAGTKGNGQVEIHLAREGESWKPIGGQLSPSNKTDGPVPIYQQEGSW